MPYRFHQQFMIYRVKVCLDIHVQYPCPLPASLPRLFERIGDRLVRSVSTGIRMELLFQYRLQEHFHPHLDHPIHYRWNPQGTNTAVRLWDSHASDRLWIMLILSVLHSLLSAIGGVHSAIALEVQTAPATVVCGTLLFVLAWVFSPRHGLLRLWLRRQPPLSEPEKIFSPPG